MLARSQGAEVARPQEHDQFVLVGGRVQWVVHPKAGVAEIAPGLGVERVVAKVEVFAAVGQVAHRAVGRDFVDAHRSGLVQAEVEILGLEGQCFGAPGPPVGPEPDVAHLVVVQGGEVGGQLVAI
ncbi:hypothetical protein FQZ97_840960 [compost metagenome]